MPTLRRLARAVARRASGAYRAGGALLAAGLGAAALGAGLFALLARGVAGGVTRAADETAVEWALAHPHPALDAIGLAGAALGSSIALWAVLALGTVGLWRQKQRASVAVLWASLVGGFVLNRLLKAAFDRPRPALRGETVDLLGWSFAFPTSPSFPSGHAVTAVVVYGTLAYLVARLEATPRLRRWTLGGAVALVLLIGLSRVYLGVHYPTDVLAGYLAGAVWVAACALSVETVQRVRARRARPTAARPLTPEART